MTGLLLSRRALVSGLIAALAAPAIVRASSLMPVKSFDMPPGFEGWEVIGPDGDMRKFIVHVQYRVLSAAQERGFVVRPALSTTTTTPHRGAT